MVYDSQLKKFARITTVESSSIVDMNRIFNYLRNNKFIKTQASFEEFLDKQKALNWILTDID